MAHDVFISYSRTDKEKADKVCLALEQNNISYWIDRSMIHGGQNFAREIVPAIRNCKVVVFISSLKSNESKYTEKEITLAENDYKKIIIPFRIEDVPYSDDLQFFLCGKTRIEASENFDDGVKDLVHSVLKETVVHTLELSTPIETEVTTIEDFKIRKENYVCYIGHEVTTNMIQQAVEIDHSVYTSEFRGVLETCIKWWQKNPEIYVMIEDVNTHKIIGYINAMPLECNYYDKIKSGDTIDIDIPIEELCTYDFPDNYDLYLSSIAIHPDYQNTGAFKCLYDAFILNLLKLFDREVYISKILADAVSAAGEKLCKYIGLNKCIATNHNSLIYEGSLLPITIRATTTLSKSLVSKYNNLQ